MSTEQSNITCKTDNKGYYERYIIFNADSNYSVIVYKEFEHGNNWRVRPVWGNEEYIGLEETLIGEKEDILESANNILNRYISTYGNKNPSYKNDPEFKRNPPTTTPAPRRAKPIRDMVSTTATTISSVMVVARDLIQTVGYEVKSSKMESIVEFKANLKEYAKELNITEKELLDLINN